MRRRAWTGVDGFDFWFSRFWRHCCGFPLLGDFDEGYVELSAAVKAGIAREDEAPVFALDFALGHGAAARWAAGFRGFNLDLLVERVFGGLGEALIGEFGLAGAVVVGKAVRIVAEEGFPGVWTGYALLVFGHRSTLDQQRTGRAI